MAACIPFYPVELKVDVNHPPVIVDETPPISTETLFVEIGQDCIAQEFIAPIVEFDGDETVFSKWIFTADLGDSSFRAILDKSTDDTLGDPELVTALLGEQGPIAAPDARVVFPGLKLVLNADVISQSFQIPQALVGNDRTHLLELFVSDRNYDEGDDQFSVEPLPNPGEPRQIAAQASWLLTVTNADPCAVTP